MIEILKTWSNVQLNVLFGFIKQLSLFLCLPLDQRLSSSPSFLRNLWGGSDLREGVHLLVPYLSLW